jgi:hypothetical protein
VKTLKALYSLSLLLVGALTYANLTIPYGNHILIAYELQARDGILNNITYNEIFSSAYLSVVGVSCTYKIRGLTSILDDENSIYHAVPASFVLYDFYRDKLNLNSAVRYDKYVSKVISLCDREVLLHKSAPPPIVYAILTGKLQYVEQMVAKGVVLDFRMNRPGKDSDGMNPKEYAKYLENKNMNNKQVNDYKSIVDYLNGL